jgi:hypothetical protein
MRSGRCKTFFWLLIIFFISHELFAQDKNLPRIKATAGLQKNVPGLREQIKQFNIIKLPSAQLSQYVKARSTAVFHLKLTESIGWDLELEPAGITAPNYKLQIQIPGGLQTISSKPDFLYKGRVKGSGKSEIRLAIKEGFVYGSIATAEKEYFIEPLSRFSSTAQKDEFILYDAKEVISKSISCGVQDTENVVRQAEDQQPYDIQGIQSGTCKKLKFISAADFSMYQKFNQDVYAVEAALLANLNLAQSAFTTLNLGSDSSTDIGQDLLQFEAEGIVVSTSLDCDFTSNSNNANDLVSEFGLWQKNNFVNSGAKIYQFWTTRDLFTPLGNEILGYSHGAYGDCALGSQFLKYHTDDAASLRLLVAHETGHNLACPHDDERKSDVKDFIMYSHANAGHTRFSTLPDFGGLQYSSQLTIRNRIFEVTNCLEECGTPSCDEIKNINITYFNTYDSVLISWEGTGNFITRFKVKDSSQYSTGDMRLISRNQIVLRGLQPCTAYIFDVQKICDNQIAGRTSSVIFTTSSLSVTANPTITHADRYDLQLNLDCKNCSSKEFKIFIDKRSYTSISDAKGQVLIKDLFADGARHKIEIWKDSSVSTCRTTFFYTAPYYRANSIKLVLTDFNDCSLPAKWVDSLLSKASTSAPDAKWLIDDKNFFTSRTARGSLDSSCMIYYNSHNSFNTAYRGALSLTSPVINLTKYKDIKLHFDYNFLAYVFSSGPCMPSLSVEVFDGVSWVNVFKGNSCDQWPKSAANIRNVWDSIPSRVFIDLDQYKNKNFQVRFIADDGSLAFGKSTFLLAALDNIVVDGYFESPGNATLEYTLYPNPTPSELFIQFERVRPDNLSYRIMDVLGRVIVQRELVNNQVSLEKLSKGIYLFELFENNQSQGTKKFIKQ